MTLEQLYTTRDLAKLWGVTTQYVRDQVRDGRLRATVQITNGPRTLYRFSLSDIVAYDPDAAARLQRAS